MKKVFLVFVLAFFVTMHNAFARVTRYTLKVEKEYPHNVEAYTQGLFFDGGVLCESSGLYGKSAFRRLDLETGKSSRTLKFAKKYFLEGSVMLGGKLYFLTWQSKVAFVYDAATLTYEKTIRYPREGWGLTTDGKSLIASDGSSTIYFMDRDFNVKRRLNVTINGHPASYLNELEWIDGKIWANVYTTDLIVVINPESGVSEAVIDCSGLLPDSLRTSATDVLNGIAVNPADGKIYLTGKNWPRLYEVSLVEKR